MTINKFQGKTKEEAIEKAKAEFGENAVIMNVREIKPKGFLGIFKSSTYEVTAAMQEKDVFPSISRKTVSHAPDKINYAADEEIKLPPYSDSKEAFGEISREIEKIEKKLLNVYSKETCYPKCRDNWNDNNKTLYIFDGQQRTFTLYNILKYCGCEMKEYNFVGRESEIKDSESNS